MTVRILIGDCRDRVADLQDRSVQTCVTSPPYFALRSYLPDDHPDKADEIGLEESPEAFVDALVEVFRAIKPKLRLDGTLWVNLGDSAATSGGLGAGGNAARIGRAHQQRSVRPGSTYGDLHKAKDLMGVPWAFAAAMKAGWSACTGCGLELRRDLWPVWHGARVCVGCAVERRDYRIVPTEAGWHLRQEIIWHKPNPLPERVQDRPTRAHEQIFLFTLSSRDRVWRAKDTGEWAFTRPDLTQQIANPSPDPEAVKRRPMVGRWAGLDYFYDWEAIAEEVSENTHARVSQDVLAQAGSTRANGGSRPHRPMKAMRGRSTHGRHTLGEAVPAAERRTGGPKTHAAGEGIKNNTSFAEGTIRLAERRNARSVWTIGTRPFKGAHHAVFPWPLAERCILASTRPGDLVLDPFGGAGTTALAAERIGRDTVLIELNEESARIADARLRRANVDMADARPEPDAHDLPLFQASA